MSTEQTSKDDFLSLSKEDRSYQRVQALAKRLYWRGLYYRLIPGRDYTEVECLLIDALKIIEIIETKGNEERG